MSSYFKQHTGFKSLHGFKLRKKKVAEIFPKFTKKGNLAKHLHKVCSFLPGAAFILLCKQRKHKHLLIISYIIQF